MLVATRIVLVLVLLTAVLGAQPSAQTDYEQALAEATELGRQGNLGGLIEKLKPLVERFPEQAEPRHHLGLAFYQQQDYPGAIEYLSQALQMEAENSAAWRQTVEHLGLAYYFSHRTKDAAPLLGKTVQWKGEDTYIRYALAMCHVYNHDADLAREAFAALYGIASDSAQAALLASHFMSRENFGLEAEALVRQAQEIDPSLPDLNYRLGVIALANGDHEQAVDRFETELGRNPLHPMAWHYLGEARSQAGKLDEAVSALERAIWLNLRNVPSYVLIGNVYSRLEQYSLAENALQQAISLDPRNYQARFLLARVYQKTNRPDLAKQEMERARQFRDAGP